MKKIFILLTVTLIMASCNKAEVIECDGTVYSFSTDVQPLLNQSCNTAGCHQAGFSAGDFTSYNGVLAKVNNGSLKLRVENGSMPESTGLTLEEKKIIVCWSESGGLDN